MSEGRASVRVRAPGKVNLALRVGGVRPDGYHPLITVFQALSLVDDLTARPAEPGRYTITVHGAQAHLVPADDSNLAVRAARLLAADHGGEDSFGVELEVHKTIPVTGGMAGGSADAAAALAACTALWGLDVPEEDLRRLGGRLGADVPFCQLGGSALGRGRGDELEIVPTQGRYHWVLALPDVELSTPEVFRRFDELAPGVSAPPPVPEALLRGLAEGDVEAVAAHLVNDLEPAALSLRPHLREVLDAGRAVGALAGLVSGSGPTCAFLARDEPDAARLASALDARGLARSVRRAVGPVPGARVQTSSREP